MAQRDNTKIDKLERRRKKVNEMEEEYIDEE